MLSGSQLFPKAGMPQFLITVETPRGSNIEETDKAVKYVESVVARKAGDQVLYVKYRKGESNNFLQLLSEK